MLMNQNNLNFQMMQLNILNKCIFILAHETPLIKNHLYKELFKRKLKLKPKLKHLSTLLVKR
jgi:hemoglobin-like flavoprotein